MRFKITKYDYLNKVPVEVKWQVCFPNGACVGKDSREECLKSIDEYFNVTPKITEEIIIR